MSLMQFLYLANGAHGVLSKLGKRELDYMAGLMRMVRDDRISPLEAARRLLLAYSSEIAVQETLKQVRKH